MELKRSLLKYFLPRVLSHACPAVIPRSGERGQAVNCYEVHIDKGDAPYLVLTGIEDDLVQALEYDGDRYAVDQTLNISEIDPGEINVSHYFGLAEVRYRGIFDLACGRLLRFPYAKIRMSWLVDSVAQRVFNRRSLVVKTRLEVLKELVELASSGAGVVDSMSLMNKRYGYRWAGHPDWQSHHDQIVFFLDGLVDTQELEKTQHGYRPTGLAIKTLEDADEQDRRHRTNFIIQVLLGVLTAVSALMAAAQAGLIRLPLFFDWTN